MAPSDDDSQDDDLAGFSDDVDDLDHAEDPGRDVLPRDDRVWVHPSELATAARPSSSASPRRGPRVQLVTIGLVGGFVLGAVVNPFRSLDSDRDDEAALTTTSPVPGDGSVTAAVETITPSLVSVSVSDDSNAMAWSGTGVVLRERGYILTSARLVTAADTIEVTTVDDVTYSADIVGVDFVTDVAIIRSEDLQLAPPTFALNEAASVGDPIVVVTMTSGDSSSREWTTGEVVRSGQWLMPIDAEPVSGISVTDIAVDATNSGSVVTDYEGDIMGLIVEPADSGGAAVFVPATQVIDIAGDLITSGTVQRTTLGVVTVDDPAGVRVILVEPDSPAESAGIEVGEVLSTFDGVTIESPIDLAASVRARPANTVARIEGVLAGSPVLHLTRLATAAPYSDDD